MAVVLTEVGECGDPVAVIEQGVAMEDVAVAVRVVARARTQGTGLEIPI